MLKMKKNKRLKLIAILLLFAFIALFYIKVRETFRSRTGEEIYEALFGKQKTNCVAILNYQDQVVPKIDYAIWLQFETCPEELKKILSKYEFSAGKVSTDNWDGKIPYGETIKWFNPFKNPGLTLILKISACWKISTLGLSLASGRKKCADFRLSNNIMRQLIIILIISGLLQSCSDNSPKNTTADNSVIDNSDSFLDLFSEIKYQDLHIYTPPFDTSDHSDKFDGKQIDRSFYPFLIFNNYINPTEIDTFYHYFACFKFKLTDNKTGLIIRRPSQYSETAIDLYTWDNLAKKVTNIINLADAFGDEGWHFVQDAWIEDVNKDNQLDIVIRKKEFDQDLDDPTKISRSDTSFVFLGDGKTFKQTNFKIDRNKYQLKHWVEE